MSKNKKRAPQEKMQIVLEALQNDNISETCRKYGIYENQFYQ
ncbi:transposase [Natroniella acetigena]|nr:helix-turn-helix domain-containing protein [Natroniella acetigena]MCK8827929.1 transposase [Natroniella acetigena]